MKNDPYFKFVAAVIIAGVIAAFITPREAVRPVATATQTVIALAAAEPTE